MDLIKQALDEQGILTLTLNRPEKLNALSHDLLLMLGDALRYAKDNRKVKGLILTGSGKAFCAGADISRLAECNVESGYRFACDGQMIFKLLETMGKPSIAAVNGFAFGGGCELAIAATLRIAAAEAKFGQPEVKLGIIPGYGGTQRLARLIGKGRALDLCLSGRTIEAQTALDWGLVSDVVAGDNLLAYSKQRLTTILAMAPLALASVMEVIDHGYDLPLNEALHLEAVHFAKLCASADKQEGVAAFLEKRIPHFSGE